MLRRVVVAMVLLLATSSILSGQKRIQIWGDVGKYDAREALLTAYVCAGSKLSVIVCPGGSYCWVDGNAENRQVAKWLNSIGISAFVLDYRVAGVYSYFTHDRLVFRGHRHPDMIADLQRAINIVRARSEADYGVVTEKLGVMGFSAGGHLVMMSACFSETDFGYEEFGVLATTSLRPDFVVSLYPVVTMHEPYVHKRSRRGLLGDNHTGSVPMRDSLSLEKHIPADCPPVFLANAEDDPLVDYHNSVLLDKALTEASVNHKYYLFHSGGHGFGASTVEGTDESQRWMKLFQDWIHDLYPDVF